MCKGKRTFRISTEFLIFENAKMELSIWLDVEKKNPYSFVLCDAPIEWWTYLFNAHCTAFTAI